MTAIFPKPGIYEVTSADGSLAVVDGQGPTVDLAVVIAPGSGAGTIISTTPALAPENIKANRSVDLPTILGTTKGNVNLGSENTGGKGITSGDNNNIAGGLNNIIAADLGSVGGGGANEVSSDGGTVGGGLTNHIRTSDQAAVGGGEANTINDCDHGVIAGGEANEIGPGAGTTSYAAIGGGNSNIIYHALRSVIGGGLSNEISHGAAVADSAGYSGIACGQSNQIQRGTHSAIIGGQSNTIGPATDSSHSAILGGLSNDIDGADFACASGRGAEISDAGAWLWADSANQTEASKGVDSFFIKAGGGLWFRETDGFKGEELRQRQAHASTIDASNTDLLMGALSTDQHTFMVMGRAHASRDSGANFFTKLFELTIKRTGGSNTVVGAAWLASNSRSDGTGSTLVLTLLIGSTSIFLRVAGNAAEDWEWTFNYTIQEGGFTS